MTRLLKNAVWLWMVFQAFAVLMGVARRWLFAGSMTPMAAHVLALFLEALFVLALSWAVLRRQREHLTRFRLLVLGVIWLGLTAIMDFAVPAFVLDQPLPDLLARLKTPAGAMRGGAMVVFLLSPVLAGWVYTRAKPPTYPPVDPEEDGEEDSDAVPRIPEPEKQD